MSPYLNEPAELGSTPRSTRKITSHEGPRQLVALANLNHVWQNLLGAHKPEGCSCAGPDRGDGHDGEVQASNPDSHTCTQEPVTRDESGLPKKGGIIIDVNLDFRVRCIVVLHREAAI